MARHIKQNTLSIMDKLTVDKPAVSKLRLNKLYSACLLTMLALPSSYTFADIQSRSASLNYSQKALSNSGNAAAAALIVDRNDAHVVTGGMIDVGVNVEFGNLDELFNTINSLADDFQQGGDIGNGGDNENDGESGFDWENLFDKYPDLESRLDALQAQIVSQAALMAIVASEGYGKAELNSEAAFILNDDLYGGTLMMMAAFRGSTKAVGVFEDISFNAEQAKLQLENLNNLNPSDPVQTLDLTGGIFLSYDPASQQSRLSIKNDSLLLVKATKINQLSLSYSRKAASFSSGDLYWGVKPTYYRVGLTNVGTRIGDVTDAEDLLNDIKDANFIYESGFDIDLGLVWAAKHYQLGAAVNNAIEQTYKFPELDAINFKSAEILTKLNKHAEYTMERQLKLEASIYTEQRHWNLNVEVDANAVTDQMRDEYQWLTVTGGYESDNWWLPSARVGYSQNLAGTELSYVTAGVTVLKYLNIDLASTLDDVNIDGNKIMRGLSVRMGVQFDY